MHRLLDTRLWILLCCKWNRLCRPARPSSLLRMPPRHALSWLTREYTFWGHTRISGLAGALFATSLLTRLLVAGKQASWLEATVCHGEVVIIDRYISYIYLVDYVIKQCWCLHSICLSSMFCNANLSLFESGVVWQFITLLQ